MGNVATQKVSQETVKDFDVQKYMGDWFEIAKYPFKWEKDCELAKAIYKWDSKQQKILVENQCWIGQNMIRSRTAKAWIPDKTDPGKLLIDFDHQPKDPGPGNYWIYWTDYQNAIVGGPTGTYLWWLSRNPTVKAREVEPMLKRIRSYGYRTDKLLARKGAVTK